MNDFSAETRADAALTGEAAFTAFWAAVVAPHAHPGLRIAVSRDPVPAHDRTTCNNGKGCPDCAWRDYTVPATPARVLRRARELGDTSTRGVFMGISFLKEGTTRRLIGNVHGMYMLWADIDWKGRGHAEENLPTEAQALRIVERLPLTFAGLIRSGGGCYPVAALTEPLNPADPADMELIRRWEHALQQVRAEVAAEDGCALKIDPGVASNPNRQFRFPGSVNRKTSEPREVTFTEHVPGHRYSRKELDQLLPPLPPKPERSPATASPGGGDMPLTRLNKSASMRDFTGDRMGGHWDGVTLYGDDGKVNARVHSDDDGVSRLEVFGTRHYDDVGISDKSEQVTPAGLLIHLCGGNAKLAKEVADRFCPEGGNFDANGFYAFLEENGTPEAIRSALPAAETDPWADEPCARRFVDWAAGTILNVRGNGWMRWEEPVWRDADEADIGEMVCQLARIELEKALQDHASAVISGDKEKVREARENLRGAEARRNVTRIHAVVKLARGKARADLGDFDQNPFELVCLNGVVDLKTLVLLPHDKARRVTKCTWVNYRRDACHPDLDKVLTALAPEELEYLRRRAGQAATGEPPRDAVIAVLQGGGSNGKSTLVTGISKALGDYAAPVSDRALLGPENGHPTEKMQFRGLRLAFLEETPEEARLNVQQVKQLAGTPMITARLCGKDNVTFAASHSVLINTNYLPVVNTTDRGTWRRLKRIAFTRTFQGNAKDEGLLERILRGREQQEAFLAWMLEVTPDVIGKGIGPAPASVEKATLDWREFTDDLLKFLPLRLAPASESDAVLTSELFEEFNMFLGDEGRNAWALQKFTQRLDGHRVAEKWRLERKDRARTSRRTITGPKGNEMKVSGQVSIITGCRWLRPDENPFCLEHRVQQCGRCEAESETMRPPAPDAVMSGGWEVCPLCGKPLPDGSPSAWCPGHEPADPGDPEDRDTPDAVPGGQTTELPLAGVPPQRGAPPSDGGALIPENAVERKPKPSRPLPPKQAQARIEAIARKTPRVLPSDMIRIEGIA